LHLFVHHKNRIGLALPDDEHETSFSRLLFNNTHVFFFFDSHVLICYE
jgi:hypothetical protein